MPRSDPSSPCWLGAMPATNCTPASETPRPSLVVAAQRTRHDRHCSTTSGPACSPQSAVDCARDGVVMSMDRHSKVERKFDADAGAPLPDLSEAGGAVSEAVKSQLEATYFDTADAQLARHLITLCRRTGGDDDGWHLKLSAGVDERTEVRLPLGRATATVPVSLAREVRAIVRDHPLVPIAVLHITRVERRLLDGNGNALATIADDTVNGQRLTDGAVEVSNWREVEVELLDDDRTFLDAVGGRLCAACLTPSGGTS